MPTNAADILERDHRELDGLLAELLRELARAVKALRLVADFGNEAETFDRIRPLVAAVAARLAAHNDLEERSVYPRADLSPSARSAIQKELTNLPNRFSS